MVIFLNMDEQELYTQEEITSYWEKEVCGTRNTKINSDSRHYEEIRDTRYSIEKYIKRFAFELPDKNIDGKKVLEIGVGAGSDFIEFLKRGAICSGIDATNAAIKETKKNIEYAIPDKNYQLEYLEKVNAEKLPFDDNYFDIVYSHGVLHCAQNTMTCISEAIRVLKPGGLLKIMVYSDFSATGIMLWMLYGLMRFKIFSSQEEIIYKYLESPGTKCYSNKEFKKILEGFSLENVVIKKYVGAGDLLAMPPSAKYKGNPIYAIAKRVYPRYLIRKFESLFGMALTAIGRKPFND